MGHEEGGVGRIGELLEYLEKGKEFTEELIKENERLRMRELQLEKEMMDICTRMDPETMNRLINENQRLEEKVEHLEARFDEIEEENQDFVNRYVEVQAQNDNLLNLYVSSYQLHSTLDPKEVLNVIEEIVLNLIGAENYFVCMLDERKKHPVIMVGEGPDGPIRGLAIEEMDEILAGVLQEGEAYFRSENEGDVDSPYMACTPLKVKNEVVGAISITKLMNQKKNGLTTIDHELLSLLADHAATALVSANLYKRTERKLKTVEGFIEMLKLESREGANG